METYLFYIGKAAIACGAFYLAFLVLFQNQKQFNFNRIYLPVSLAVSFIIPLITFTTIKYIDASQFDSNSFAYLAETTSENVQSEFVFEWYHYLLGIYLPGVFGFLFHLLLGHFKAIQIVRKSTVHQLFETKVHVSQKDIHPFSFFNKIVISEKTLNSQSLQMIVQHENIHVTEKHTLDILFTEILFLLQWFNPFAWLLKDAVKSNLEYKTDNQITKNHNPKTYQMAMLALADKKGVAPFLTALNGSQLKNRIIMMKKKTENKFAILKQLVVLPLLAILVMGLSAREVKTEVLNSSTEITYTKNLVIKVDGKIIPSDSEKLSHFDFSKGIDGYEIIQALNINPDEIISNSLNLDLNPPVFEIKTKDLNSAENEKIKISGKVTDQNGVPINGATIIIKGKTIGTITDPSGNYEVELTEENETLIFMMVGFEKQEVFVGEKSEINVLLKEDKNSKLGEINVTGYAKDQKATSNKNLVSGKITDENGKPLNGVAVLLKGKTIGTITDSEGNYQISMEEEKETLVFMMAGYEKKEIEAKGGKTINVKLNADDSDKSTQIRAVGYGEQTANVSKISIRNTNDENEPLYIVDGKEVSSIDHISPDFIESISVLKDQSATALYGEKGKNGVILVTTKSQKQITQAAISGNPIVIVDGEVFKSVEEADVPAENIQSIDVLKGESATNRFGEKAKDGAIIITTKDQTNSEKKPLLIIDGKESDLPIEDLDPEQIHSMNVLKDESATSKYGEKAKDGAIEITTKGKSENAKITSSLELRKFIASKIKYPVEAQEKGQQGTVFFHIEPGKTIKVVSVHDYKQNDIINLDEVVVVGYGIGKLQNSKKENEFPSLVREAHRIVSELPEIDIPEFKGKAVGISIKFMLQQKME